MSCSRRLHRLTFVSLRVTRRHNHRLKCASASPCMVLNNFVRDFIDRSIGNTCRTSFAFSFIPPRWMTANKVPTCSVCKKKKNKAKCRVQSTYCTGRRACRSMPSQLSAGDRRTTSCEYDWGVKENIHSILVDSHMLDKRCLSFGFRV
jgi:hypothetical protein